MQLKKKGLIYKIAYGYKDEDKIPEKVRLCTLPWHFFKGFFLMWPAVLILIIAVGVTAFAICILFGKRPPISKDEEKELKYGHYLIEYKHWPTIRGFRVLPIHFIILYAVYVFMTTFMPDLVIGVLHALVSFVKFSSSSSGLVFWEIVLGVSILIWLRFQFPKTEIGRVAIGYVKAKKEKICPLVEFV